MKVTLNSHGGLAAGIKRPPQVVESSTLPQGDAAELARLVAAARETPPVLVERPGRDRDTMSYTITVEENGREPTVIKQGDVNLSGPFASLMEWIERHSARK